MNTTTDRESDILSLMGLSKTTLLTIALTFIFFPVLLRKAIFKSRSRPQHLETFNQYINSYSTLRPAALTTHLTPTFTHTVLPLSLNWPSRDTSAFKTHASVIFSLFRTFRMIPQPEDQPRVFVDKERNTVIAHCRMGGEVNRESEKGKILVGQGITEWWNECVLFVEMDEAGRMVKGVREFVDSRKAGELMQRLSGIQEA
ncbi:hypothetical protein M011DRAFT_478360 [Sporormia fimetaria CBS 119925]|uniref:Uncharacterized protein n=1 Tax=Sporormia fimetaria CBS 119925 TaxID=1340428 RepID=A0A6A6V9I5_9PLEO|nr:hypothetical protein M011DRAFT_478360 [Sporormia fimetaria CBS 119925]